LKDLLRRPALGLEMSAGLWYPVLRFACATGLDVVVTEIGELKVKPLYAHTRALCWFTLWGGGGRVCANAHPPGLSSFPFAPCAVGLLCPLRPNCV
jgi:hypothetical protein